MDHFQLDQLFSYQDINEIIDEITPAAVLDKIKTVHGSGSGLDADKLDGQEGSYYQDAANLNAGTLSRARLSALWRNNDTNSGANPFIQAGTITLTTGDVWEDIDFDYAFTAVPIFIMSLEDSTLTINSGKYQNLTTTGVQVSADRPAVVSWIAIGAKT